MQYPEPDDGAWPARVLRNRRMNQVPETENPATRLRFMHQRRHEQRLANTRASNNTRLAAKAPMGVRPMS